MVDIIKIGIVVVPFLLLINVFLIGAVSWTYNVFTHEESVAIVSFDTLGEHSYIAHLSDYDGDKIGDFQIHGDQWRIDAKFLKMKYGANLLGLDSRYGLERIQGRYSNINDENTKVHLAHDLGEDSVIDFFTIWGWNFFVDSQYGSSSYSDIKVNYEYSVFKSQTGLLIRSKPIVEEKERSSVGSFLEDTGEYWSEKVFELTH